MKLTRFSQYGFPFHPPGAALGNPVMHRLRGAGRRGVYAGHPGWKRLAAKAAMLTLWPFGAAGTALRAGRHHRAAPTRMLDAWRLALRHNVPPLEYFLHRLWEPQRRARLDDYLYWHENSAVLMALNRAAGWQPGEDAVSDKRLFHAFCKAQDLPTPEIYPWQPGGALPQRDLWLKPTRAKSAIGAERWRWRDAAYHRNGQSLPPAQMNAHIAAHAQTHGDTLVQVTILAHPDHAPRIGDAPLCARIVTGRRKNGTVEIIDAMAMWPRNGRVVTQGGDCAMINTGTGRIGPTYQAPGRPAANDIEDMVLQDWPAALNAVRRGHAALPHYVFLGWDVAFGPDGPTLLETNSGWGAFHFQLVPDHPIADTAFAAIAAEYL